MAKTLSFTDTSPQTVKIGDTTTSFTLVCGNDNVAVDLTNATSITVKLGNTSGYLKSATVDPASLTDPTTGQITVNFNADLMTSLTAGSYALEVWVVDSTGTSIYPSDGSTGFNIANNIQSTNGSTITTITFDDFVEAMNKAASTIAKGDKGDKGDTGTVDNAGLTTAPAFVSLQAQVDNSAVGTNLLLNTSDYSNNWIWYVTPSIDTTQKPAILHYPSTTLTSGASIIAQQTIGTILQPSTTYTASFYAKGSGSFQFFCYPSVSATISSVNGVVASSTGTDCKTTIPLTSNYERYTITFTTLSSISDSKSFLLRQNYDTSDTSYNTVEAYVYGMKLEKGSLATDWCPNPSEVLTQADYAKIKAAIVALGGSLS